MHNTHTEHSKYTVLGVLYIAQRCTVLGVMYLYRYTPRAIFCKPLWMHLQLNMFVDYHVDPGTSQISEEQSPPG